MCRMNSSTDSDSEISPRWSDTSALGGVSAAPGSRTSHRIHKSGRHTGCSSTLDPYDGSSEDSDGSKVVPGRGRRRNGKGDQRRRLLNHQCAALTVSEVMSISTRDSLTHQQAASPVRTRRGGESEPCVRRACSREEGDSLTAKDVHDMDVEVQREDATKSSTCCTSGLHSPEERSVFSDRRLRPLCKRKGADSSEAEPGKRRRV